MSESIHPKASPELVAIWVAAEMRAGGAYAHSIVSLNAMHGSHAAHS